MDAAIRRLVRERADQRCEYCLLPERHSELLHHVEHVVARQHGGTDDFDNLALACHRCNLHKGPNLTGMDSELGTVELLFHSRRDRWAEHFEFRDALIFGMTACGRATVAVLAMNDPRRVELRLEVLKLGERDRANMAPPK